MNSNILKSTLIATCVAHLGCDPTIKPTDDVVGCTEGSVPTLSVDVFEKGTKSVNACGALTIFGDEMFFKDSDNCRGNYTLSGVAEYESNKKVAPIGINIMSKYRLTYVM
jgi:hypothetical protein